MKSASLLFTTSVNLPCTVYCGQDSLVQIAATALSINTKSLVLALSAGVTPYVGARVKLEMLLPVSKENPTAKCLSVRAKVIRSTPLPDGRCQAELSFWRVNFKDVDPKPRKQPKAMKAQASEWAM
jgi:hypothetical protein